MQGLIGWIFRSGLCCALAMMIGCAHTADPARASNSQERAAPKDAVEILQRSLELIVSVNGPEDFSPQHVERIMGGRVVPSGHSPEAYRYRVEVDGWLFILSRWEQDDRHVLIFSFKDRNQSLSDRASDCVFGYEDYKKALEAKGFQRTRIYSKHGTAWSERFEHDDVAGGVGLQVKSKANTRHPCVTTVDVFFRKPGMHGP
jgi:hypothetical protein